MSHPDLLTSSRMWLSLTKRKSSTVTMSSTASVRICVWASQLVWNTWNRYKVVTTIYYEASFQSSTDLHVFLCDFALGSAGENSGRVNDLEREKSLIRNIRRFGKCAAPGGRGSVSAEPHSEPSSLLGRQIKKCH